MNLCTACLVNEVDTSIDVGQCYSCFSSSGWAMSGFQGSYNDPDTEYDGYDIDFVHELTMENGI